MKYWQAINYTLQFQVNKPFFNVIFMKEYLLNSLKNENCIEVSTNFWRSKNKLLFSLKKKNLIICSLEI